MKHYDTLVHALVLLAHLIYFWQAFFMRMGTQRKYVIEPKNRLADGCPAQRVGEDGSSLFD